MIRVLLFRFCGRRAVSTLIGGLIVLILLLTALGTVTFVSQQFFQYQQIVNSMAQYRNQQQLAERLVINSPGLVAYQSWNGCGGCNMYNMSLSNLGAIGVQVVRIYINSTGPTGTGCSSPNPQPCILGPASTATSYAFSKANGFINPGEQKHFLLLWLPSAVILPNPTPSFPENTVMLVTSRGNVFTFQWPLQPQSFGQSQSAFSSGIMKVAYLGTYNSKNEPAAGGTKTSTYCHQESSQSYPAPAGYAEKLSGISSVSGGVLWFVNPWITQQIMNSANNNGPTTVYIYVNVVNTGNTAYSVTAATIDLTWSGSNHLDGWLLGVFYNGQFYSSSPTIAPGASYYAIFQLTIFSIGNPPSSTQSVMLWGSASITDNTKDQSYYGGTILLSGLWIRASC
jgi:hypothetical protein